MLCELFWLSIYCLIEKRFKVLQQWNWGYRLFVNLKFLFSNSVHHVLPTFLGVLCYTFGDLQVLRLWVYWHNKKLSWLKSTDIFFVSHIFLSKSSCRTLVCMEIFNGTFLQAFLINFYSIYWINEVKMK